MTNLWAKSKFAFVAAFFAVLTGGIMLWGLHTVQIHGRLKDHGATVEGKLEMTTVRRVNFIPTRYTFSVAYRNTTGNFDVSRQLFYQYVDESDKFRRGAEVPIIYLPEDTSVAMPVQMLQVWFYWGWFWWIAAFLGLLACTMQYCRKALVALR